MDCHSRIAGKGAENAAGFRAEAVSNRRYRRDAYPIDVSCDCAACAGGFARAYLHHLFAANEVLSAILCSIHNVHFYQSLVRGARQAVVQGRYGAFRDEFLALYGEAGSEAAEEKQATINRLKARFRDIVESRISRITRLASTESLSAIRALQPEESRLYDSLRGTIAKWRTENAEIGE